MNAIVGLCHFCEAHGPRPVFCTFTTDDEKVTTESSVSSSQCTGCKSLGPETVITSRDEDGVIYCSRETVPNTDVTNFLRQAAIRSITCEVSWSKEGGVVYFSDARGHVLSFNFQLKDTRARGLTRWFSIIVLMKDKLLLMNITPLLSKHMQEIAKELQGHAENIYDQEQNVCSQRALRLNTGSNYFGQSRSLVQLTGEEEIFKRLHTHFAMMLKSGALNYTETLYTSQDLLKRLSPKENKSVSIFSPNICYIQDDSDSMTLRNLESLLTKNIFRVILYCTLTGINIIISTKSIPAKKISQALTNLLPVPYGYHVPHIGGSESEDHAPSACKCILLANEHNAFRYKWSGELPIKCPTMMNKLENAMNNAKFDEDTLNQYIKNLQLEWLGIAKTIKSTIDASGAKSEAVVKLKQIFGVAPHDESLLNFWISNFCS